jgi:hypothetical protein
MNTPQKTPQAVKSVRKRCCAKLANTSCQRSKSQSRILSPHGYSERIATMGFTSAARHAGAAPAIMAADTKIAKAINDDFKSTSGLRTKSLSANQGLANSTKATPLNNPK